MVYQSQVQLRDNCPSCNDNDDLCLDIYRIHHNVLSEHLLLCRMLLLLVLVAHDYERVHGHHRDNCNMNILLVNVEKLFREGSNKQKDKHVMLVRKKIRNLVAKD